jgi:hypothetical protein
MAIVDREIATNPPYQGLGPPVLNLLDVFVVSAKVSSNAAVFTSQTMASTINVSTAAGTQPDYARNLAYQLSLTNGTASSAMISGGTVAVYGLNIAGQTVSESKAFTALATASVPVTGSVAFMSINSISLINFSLATASSTASNSVSFSVGVGNMLGLPQPVRSSTAVPYVFIGTSIQTTVSATSATSNNLFTVVTGLNLTSGGRYGFGGVNISNALASNTPVQIYYFRNG